MTAQGVSGSDVQIDLVGVPTGRPTGEMVSIQYLRGIAAFMVVLFHLEVQLSKLGYEGYWPQGLAAGVDIFFIISGFIMWVTTAGKAMTPANFWYRRIIRIVPLYWALTTLMIVIGLVAPQLVQVPTGDFGYLAASYFFVPSTNPITGDVKPVVPLGWTLNYEMLFYVIFGLLLLARPIVRFWGTVGVLFILVFGGAFLGLDRHTPIGYFTSGIMLEFAWGMGLGYVAHKTGLLSRMPSQIGWLFVVLGLAFLAAFSADGSILHRVFISAIPATLVVAGGLVIERNGRLPHIRALHWLGDSSYSLYLSQLISLAAATVVWQKLGLPTTTAGLVAYCVFGTVVAVISGFLTYWLVEKPFLKIFRKPSPTQPTLKPTEVAV